MLSFGDFWRRHKRKVLVAAGVVGSGYVLYKLHDAYRQTVSNSASEYEDRQREIDEVIKNQLQDHFENIQRIADTMTLPYAMHYLRSRISEELDLSQLTEKLMQGKGQPSVLSPKEKLELWERLKILSFTRTTLSLWAMTILTLYIRVQVNILGRHLYIDTARGLSSGALDETDMFDRSSQQDFLATADYLSNYGMSSVIPNMQKAAMEILKEKQLRDPFSTAELQETIMRILGLFMKIGGPHHWVVYLLPENAIVYKQLVAASKDFHGSTSLPDNSKLDQLMAETQAVISSDDFKNAMETSLKKVVDGLMEEVEMQSHGGNPSSGVPLAKLLPRVAQLGPLLLEEPGQNRFIQIIRSLPEVEVFYTLLYANMPLFP